jgi:stringent starvation protein B
MDVPPRKLPPKRDVVLALLAKSSVRLFLDPRREDVVVPKWFAKRPELVLRVGYSLSPPIPDLEISETAVSCTLSFNRSPSWCEIPFAAIYAVISDTDGRGVVWPEDVPVESELLRGPRAPREERAKPKIVPPPAPRVAPPPDAPRPVASASATPLPSGASSAASSGASGPSAPAKASSEKSSKLKLPPYLRVVK